MKLNFCLKKIQICFLNFEKMGNKESKVDLSHLKEEEEIGFDTLKKIFEEYKEENQKTIPKELGLQFMVSIWKHYNIETGEVNFFFHKINANNAQKL